MIEGVVVGKACGERGCADRFDQIAGKTRVFECGELMPHGRRDQHDPAREGRGLARQGNARLGAERMIDQHRAPGMFRQQRGRNLIVGDDGRVRAPAL